jgi:hypothetical protein
LIGLTDNSQNSEIIYEIFEFLKKNSDKFYYKQDVLDFFMGAMETIFLRSMSEKNAKVLYKILQSTFCEQELDNCFRTNLKFYFKNSNGEFEVTEQILLNSITLYCKTLNEKHLKIFLLNSSLENMPTLNRLLCIAPEISEYTLSLLKQSFSNNEEKIFEIFNESKILSFYSVHHEISKTILDFYMKNFDHKKIKELVSNEEIMDCIYTQMKKLLNIF